MPHVLAQAKLQYDGGTPTDVTVNTFSFRTEDLDDPTMAQVATRVRGFYTSLGPGATNPVSHYLAGTLAELGHTIKIYDRAAPSPRAPLYMEEFDVEANAVQSLPAEVALCGSFRGPLVSGTIAARRRGRIFLGPLASGASDAAGEGPVRPTQGAKLALLGGLRLLMDASNAEASFGIWSSAGAGGFIDAVHAWVDDSFDTVRSRGPKPITRVSADRSGSLP